MIPQEKFEQFVDEAIKALPENLRKAIRSVAIIVEPFPRPSAAGEVVIKRGQVLLGLYQGVPQNVWGRNETPLSGADKITIFQSNIEALADSEAKLKALIKDVVWHEIGHHFGFNEEQIRRIEERRGKL